MADNLFPDDPKNPSDPNPQDANSNTPPPAGAPPDGQPSAGLVPTSVLPQIVLGTAGSNIISVPASDISYSGLAPGFVGLWQINFTIPANAPTGTDVPITVFMNSISSSNPAVPTQVVTTVSLK